MESNAQLRRELTEAIATVRRQIDVQRSSVGYLFSGARPSGGALAIEALESELEQLQDALRGLEGDDAQRS